MTALDVITAAMKKVGILAAGEVPSASEATDGLLALVNMLDSMSNERLVIYSTVREVFALVANQATYTWGIGGNFNSARPQLITRGYIQAAGTNPVAELLMEQYIEQQYADIIVKTVNSTIPTIYYNDDNNPLANISFWPVPIVVCNAVFYSWKPLSTFATLNTVISLPPGYLRMLVYNLAIEIAPDYGKVASDQVVAIALQSMKNIKRMNANPIYLSVDPALSRVEKGSFNWITGDTE